MRASGATPVRGRERPRPRAAARRFLEGVAVLVALAGRSPAASVMPFGPVMITVSEDALIAAALNSIAQGGGPIGTSL